MANIRQISRRINTASNIAKITKAMEMVAASKMKKAQDQAIKARAYSQALIESLQTVSTVVDPELNALLTSHEQGVELAIVISSDKGLCGSLNANLYKKLAEWRDKQENPVVIMVGKKGVTFARNYGYKLHAQFTDIPDHTTVSDIVAINTLVMEGFLKKEFKSVDLIYTDFINTLSQKAQLTRLLPLGFEKKTDSEKKKEELAKEKLPKKDYLFEPDAKTILDSLLPFYIENTIYHAFLEAKASEHSSRMVAMKNASESATDLVAELKLIFNKSRQESITNELLDITTSILGLEG
ncbi:MAG: ATP synthase F1 subunit gamma [Candidatus Woesebacteria bacterium]|jgi:F-type H+-transporting ATPase subunit gamma